jgi:4'-phosphopantetheinyl transferase
MEVRVWIAQLPPDRARLAALEEHLSPVERARADRFRRRADRERFVAARGLLRELLASRTGTAPGSVEIAMRDDGKPVLPGDGELRFNASHSGDRAAFALARGLEVGIDVERVRADRDVDAVAARALSRAELEAWRALSADRRRDAFYAAWVRKEAYAKARGEGLRVDLQAIATQPSGARRWRVVERDGAPAAWTGADLELGPGYAGAVVAEAERWELHVEDLPASRD